MSNDLGYTVRVQGRSTLITINGVECKHSDWAIRWGVSPTCVAKRLQNGFPLDKLSAGKMENRKGGVRANSKVSVISTPSGASPVFDAVVERSNVVAHWFKTPVPRVGR